jgi:hypothetical protein
MFKKLFLFVIIITFSNFILNHLNSINKVKSKNSKQKNIVNFNNISTDLSTDIDNYIDETIQKYDEPFVKTSNPNNDIKTMINDEEQKKYINGLSTILKEQKSTNAGVPINFNPNLEQQKFIKNNMDNRIVQKKDIFLPKKNNIIEAINEDNNLASF